jgi:hypothetical protein
MIRCREDGILTYIYFLIGLLAIPSDEIMLEEKKITFIIDCLNKSPIIVADTLLTH